VGVPVFIGLEVSAGGVGFLGLVVAVVVEANQLEVGLVAKALFTKGFIGSAILF
jgi:hypothetical protein